jgi:hypothetical protein
MKDIPIRVCGIPALARVTDYTPRSPATWWRPAEGPDLEWEVRDRRGRPAAWLEAKLSREDRAVIGVEILQRLEEEAREAEADGYRYSLDYHQY